MRSSELLPAPEVAAGRLVLLTGGADAPTVDLAHEGWTRTEVGDLADGVRPLLCVTVGVSGSVVDVLPVMEELRPPAIVVLGTEPPNDARLERAAVRLAAYGYRVERVADLEGDAPLLGGVVLIAAEESDADDPAAASREARRRLEDLRTGTSGGSPRSVEALQRRLRAAEGARAREAGRAAQFEQDLRWARRELALERRRLDDLERSTSYRLGQAVVQGVKDPRSVATSSRELLDRWRKRGSGDAARARAADGDGSATTDAVRSRPPIVTTVPAVAAPDRRNAVAAVVTDRTAAVLEDEVLLTRLLPHDAVDLIAALAPQAVLIESEAFAAGGPWAGAGSGAVPARDRDLAAIVDAADRAGVATVVLWSGPRWRAPGLAAIASRSTLEVAADEAGFDWVLGVPPARIASEGPPTDERLAVLAGPTRTRLPARVAEAVAHVGTGVGGAGITDPWSIWARHAAWLVPLDGPDRWQVAAAAIAGRTPVVDVDGGPPRWAAERGAVPLDGVDRVRPVPSWDQRRRAVLDGRTVTSLRVLGELLGRDLIGPTTRSTAVRLAAADDAAVDALLGQDHLPPGAVVVPPTPLSDRAVAALEAVGIRVSTYVPASARFVVGLDATRHGPGHLGSLITGWELTRAPVIGHGDVGDLRRGTVGQVDAADLLVERDRVGADGVLAADTPAVLVPDSSRRHGEARP